MTEIYEYGGSVLSTEPKFKLFGCGSAKLDETWKGKVTCSPVSRLYYVKTGSFFLKINGQKINLTSGNWYIVPSGSSYEYGCKGETCQLFFHFNLYGTEKIDLFERNSSVLSLKGTFNEADDIAELLKSDSDISVLCIKNAVMKILLKMIRECKIDINYNEYSPCVINAINYINKNLSENLTIKSIAEAIFVSESTLTKHMKKELGTTVNGYIDDLILTRAARMITAGQYSLNAISNSFGFCDQFYFSRKFKAKFGVTPSEYKKLRDI
jgi:AraC-like DNA-binding protein